MVEHHVRDCVMCEEEMKEITSCSATLFESLSPYRLSGGFRDRVMNRIPARTLGVFSIHTADPRSERTSPIASLNRWMFFAAVAVLVLASVIILYNYPHRGAGIQPDEIGMVTGVEGSVKMAHAYEGSVRETVVRDIAFRGDRIVTGTDGRAILALDGPTEIKVNANTELWIDNERFIRLVRGEMWGSVGGEGRLFKVQTPSGDVTVTGTEFNVRTENNQTTVAVARGRVLFATSEGFTEVAAGQKSTAEARVAPNPVRDIPVGEIGTWARDLVPQTADNRYTAMTEREGQVGAVYMFRPNGRTRVAEVLIRRDAYGTAPLQLPGSFTVHLYSDRMEELANRTLLLSEFTGTNGRIAIDFSRDGIIVTKPFYVLFAPNVEVLKSLRVRTDIDVIKYTGEPLG
jgi:hypothetical protein